MAEDEKKKKEKAQQEEKTKKWVEGNTKKCPKCRADIQKNGGCDHMTCKTFPEVFLSKAASVNIHIRLQMQNGVLLEMSCIL